MAYDTRNNGLYLCVCIRLNIHEPVEKMLGTSALYYYTDEAVKIG